MKMNKNKKYETRNKSVCVKEKAPEEEKSNVLLFSSSGAVVLLPKEAVSLI